MKIHKKKHSVLITLLTLFLCSILVEFFIIKNVYKKPSSLLTPKAVAQAKLYSLKPQESFFVPTPTPTPIVYTGYCLGVPVLMYHHVAPWEIAKEKGFTSLDVDNGIFDLQMAYLASHGFTTIFADDLVNALRNHTPLPPKSIVVSLDDGYQDVYDYAFPVARKYGIKITLFVPTGLLGNSSGANSYYSWGELKNMLGSGIASVGNHTWSHFPMGTQGQAKDVFEISTAEKELQQNVGKNVISFAYPYGTNAGLARLYPLLQQQGIQGAFSTFGGTVQCDSFIYALHRTRVGSIPFPAYGIY